MPSTQRGSSNWLRIARAQAWWQVWPPLPEKGQWRRGLKNSGGQRIQHTMNCCVDAGEKSVLRDTSWRREKAAGSENKQSLEFREMGKKGHLLGATA